MPFLPISPNELDTTPDIIFVTPEAYCDHPSFGQAIITRILEDEGLKVAILSQPMTKEDYTKFGAPNYCFFVSGGVVDSMVNNYTVAKKKRDRDIYSEAGQTGKRPDRCVSVYTKNLKKYFPNTTVMIGGMEASLRRYAHYDYWSDSVMPSILVSSGADLLMYGMGERTVREIATMLKKNIPASSIKDVRGTAYLSDWDSLSSRVKRAIQEGEADICPTYDEVSNDKVKYVEAFNIQHENSDHIRGNIVVQKHADKYVVQNPPSLPLSEDEMDRVYALPYMRDYHPIYKLGVPAMEEVKYSITSVRGCYGGCNYCAITFHQGKFVQKRSKQSIVDEAKSFVKDKNFKGYIHDVGGPTANFRNPSCDKQLKHGLCKNKNCIGYKKCANLVVSHEEYLDILRTLRNMDGIKKVFVRSGIRYDYLMADKDDTFLRELVKYHVSGQLKVAPEHVSAKTLKAMNKPKFDVYLDFKKKYDTINASLGKKQYLVPYLISSHPDCTLDDAIDLAEYLHSIHYMPEQVQDFYPTPATKSTCMYYTGINPDTMESVYVPKSPHEKALQRALMQYRKKNNSALIGEALRLTGRTDSPLRVYATYPKGSSPTKTYQPKEKKVEIYKPTNKKRRRR